MNVTSQLLDADVTPCNSVYRCARTDCWGPGYITSYIASSMYEIFGGAHVQPIGSWLPEAANAGKTTHGSRTRCTNHHALSITGLYDNPVASALRLYLELLKSSNVNVVLHVLTWNIPYRPFLNLVGGKHLFISWQCRTRLDIVIIQGTQW
jgi:hypothetical protein